MASDISSIVKSEIVNTLENLLSASVSMKEVKKTSDDLPQSQCLKVDAQYELSGVGSSWSFHIPTQAATKFEYLMLGGVTDLKDEIDDEITDAVKEIVSTISGSITTSVNAQGYDDISSVKFNLENTSIEECSNLSTFANLFKFTFTLNDDELVLYLSVDDTSSAFFGEFMGEESSAKEDDTPTSNESAPTAAGSLLSTILSEDSVDNLRLLMDIKLRLSVRLGTKTCLLKDVISWDVGEIIELTQMTNEPLDILINNVVVGQGEAIIVDGKFGVKIKHIGDPKLDE